MTPPDPRPAAPRGSDEAGGGVYSRRNVTIAASVALVMAGLTLVAPILPLYAREFGVSRTAAGALISVFGIARLAFSLLGGVAGDRYGARKVTVAGAGLLAVSSVAAALAPNYGILLASRFVEGVGSALFATAAFQYLVQVTPKSRLGRTTALYQTGLLVGVAIGPYLGGRLAEIGDLRTPFWAYAVLAALTMVVGWFFIEDLAPTGRTIRDTFRSAGALLRIPFFWVLLFTGFVMFVMRSGARVTLLPLYAGEELGLTARAIGEILAISSVANLFIVNPGGWLVDRVGRKPVAILGLVLAGVSTAAYGYVHDYRHLLLISVVFGLTAGLASIPAPAMVGDLAPRGAEGSAVGLYRMGGDLGFVVGPVLLGAIADRGAFTFGFVLAGALLVVAAALISLFPDTGTLSRKEAARG